MDDLISRQALCEYALSQKDKSVTPNDIMRFPSAQPEQAVKDCRNCKHGKYNDYHDTYFCYTAEDCSNWDKWETSGQPKSEERTTESEQNVSNGELISKKSAIESFLADGMITAAIYVSRMPSAQPTLYGYNIKHLMLIAEILKKENLPPERVADALTDIENIINIVRREFEETLQESMNQFKI